MKSQERPYESLEQLLGYYYHQEQQFGKVGFSTYRNNSGMMSS